MKSLIKALLFGAIAIGSASAYGSDSASLAQPGTTSKIPDALKKECLQLWESRMPEGYSAIGKRFAINDASQRIKLMIEGHAEGSKGIQYPYHYICTLNNDMTLDRVITYFSIRFDEQARNARNPNGVFGNPQLPPINKEPM